MQQRRSDKERAKHRQLFAFKYSFLIHMIKSLIQHLHAPIVSFGMYI